MLYMYGMFQASSVDFQLAAILGVALAALFIVVALLLLVCFLCKRKRRKHNFRQVCTAHRVHACVRVTFCPQTHTPLH